MSTADAASKRLQQKSPAEFFANNKTIAGFDNPGKSLFTTVREFVENSLDATESLGVLPDISIIIEEIDESAFNDLVGISASVRKNVQLYKDHETASKKKKLTGSVGATATSTSDVFDDIDDGAPSAFTKREKDPKEKDKDKAKKGVMRYRITVKDNGSGMNHEDIPNMLGRVLSGTKYGVKQARGRFGLGAKMALIWSKMSTNLPIEITSAPDRLKQKSHCILDIDIHRNEPNIKLHERVANPEHWQGTEISVIIEGNWSLYKRRVLEYMQKMAVISPYAEFRLTFKSAEEKKSFVVCYPRRSEVVPTPPTEVKHHPSSVDLVIMRSLLSEKSSSVTLKKYLMTQFSSISSKHADEIIKELGDGFTPNMLANKLLDKELLQIHNLFNKLKFPQPDGLCLSPVGEYNLRLGIMKEMKPDMVATHQEPVQVFEGHPFIVEAAVSLGGRQVDTGINVHRFANRIPLLFELGSDVVTKTTQSINWSHYKINKLTDKIGVFVSIVSTKIPFKGTGKEFISAESSEIAKYVKSAIQHCLQQLKVKLTRNAALREQHDRKQNLAKFVPQAASAVFGILDTMAKRKRTRLEDGTTIVDGGENEEEELIHRVRSGDLTVQNLKSKLMQFVELIDAEEAFQSVGHLGIVRQSFHPAPFPTHETLRHFKAFGPGELKLLCYS